jgi:hypothetical protein
MPAEGIACGDDLRELIACVWLAFPRLRIGRHLRFARWVVIGPFPIEAEREKLAERLKVPRPGQRAEIVPGTNSIERFEYQVVDVGNSCLLRVIGEVLHHTPIATHRRVLDFASG